MIPIWAKDRNGKWQVFPTDLLETFSDGKQGIRDYWIPEMDIWGHLFVYETAKRRHILKKQLITE